MRRRSRTRTRSRATWAPLKWRCDSLWSGSPFKSNSANGDIIISITGVNAIGTTDANGDQLATVVVIEW